MEPSKIDSPKLPDMVMCGDHQSITKTELNVKEEHDAAEKDRKDRLNSFAKISPTSSRTERSIVEQKSHTISEHALRAIDGRRRARPLEVVSRHDEISVPGNRALVQAALGSFRWPPYLVAVWVLVLLLTHVLHCLVTMLERALPALRKFCQYFRTWTEESWRGDLEPSARIYPFALASLTGLLYVVYFCLYAAYSVALWAIEPLCIDEDKREDIETKITNYVEEVSSKSNASKLITV